MRSSHIQLVEALDGDNRKNLGQVCKKIMADLVRSNKIFRMQFMFQRAKDPFKIKKQLIDDRQMMTMMKDNSKTTR